MLAIHRRTLYLLLIISVGHVLLISVQVQSKSGLPLLEAFSFGAFSHVQQGSTGLVDGVTSIWRRYLALGGVARENDALRQQVVEMEGALASERALSERTRNLEELLRLQRSTTTPTVAANVKAGSPSPEALTITIDRGAADGLADSMAVLAPAGVVGRVIGDPAPHLAQVQLLIGRTAAAGAFLERTGTGGVVAGGYASPPLQMLYLPSSADVQVGDRVLTSGQDGLFPRGFLIGTVDRTERGSGLYRTTMIRPAVDFTHIDVVLVVKERPVVPAAPPDIIPAPAPAAPAGRGRGRGGL
jgi:rod shape-determining protein MreC